MNTKAASVDLLEISFLGSGLQMRLGVTGHEHELGGHKDLGLRLGFITN